MESAAYGGKGVLQAVLSVTSTIAPALIAKKFNVETQQKDIDAFLCELDGTKGKKRLGANAILGISMACARAGAAAAVRFLFSLSNNPSCCIGNSFNVVR